MNEGLTSSGTENIVSRENQIQINIIVTARSSLVTFEAVSDAPEFQEGKYTPTPAEIKNLRERNKNGEDLNYDYLQGVSNSARGEFWTKWMDSHIDQYKGRNEIDQAGVAEAEWIKSNIGWINQATNIDENADQGLQRRVALAAVGIETRNTPQQFADNPDQFLAVQLKQFRQTYGDDEKGVKLFIKNIAESCRRPPGGRNSEFNLTDFNQRVNAMEAFFINFGEEYGGAKIQDLMKDYLRAYVILETPKDSPLKKPMVDQVVSGLQIPSTEKTSFPNPIPVEIKTRPEVQRPLESGRRYKIKEAMESVLGTPQRDIYWVEGDIPADFINRLSEEQLRDLELTLPFYINVRVGEKALLNKSVFEPPFNLEGRNTRFDNGELATRGDSGTFALAAASAPTLEGQAAYYRMLVQGVLAVHANNPDLMRTFLDGQFATSDEQASGDLGSMYMLEQNERIRAQEAIQRRHLLSENEPLTKSQLGEVIDRLTTQLDESERLLVFGTANEQLHVDLDRTVADWKQRVSKLDIAVSNGSLTLEQIRQLEFLAHAVDTKKLVELMQGSTGAVIATASPGIEYAEVEANQKQIEGEAEMKRPSEDEVRALLPLDSSHKERTYIEAFVAAHNRRVIKNEVKDGESKIKIDRPPDWALVLTSNALGAETQRAVTWIVKRLKDKTGADFPETDLQTLGYAYNRLQEQDNLEKLPDNFIINYDNEVPIVSVDKEAFTRVAHYDVHDSSGKKHPVDVIAAKEKAISIITAVQKGEDAVAVRLGSEVIVAVLDGVSGTYFGELLAREGARVAVEVVEAQGGVSRVTEEVYNHAQQIDFAKIADQAIAIEKQTGKPVRYRQEFNTPEGLVSQRSGEKNDPMHDEYAAATLAVFQYNQEKETISTKTKGDAMIMIYHADTSKGITTYGDESANDNIIYDPTRNSVYQKTTEDGAEDIQLSPEDVVIVYSDALFEQYGKIGGKDTRLNVIPKWIAEARQKGVRADQYIAEQMGNYLKSVTEKRDGGNFRDDFSLVILDHQPKKKSPSKD